ncbi:MAG: EamA family transporter [bacterium]|nr:EamA family transporter [bacterium]
MISWLLIIILAYFFFALAFFGDKLVLSGPPEAKLYTFYVGFLNILIIFLIPFTKFSVPNSTGMIWIILEAVVYVAGLYTMFIALEKFEVSRVMTVVGAIQPILILILAWFFWGAQIITGMNFLAFAFLFLGSVIISMQKKLQINKAYLMLIFFSSFMFSLDYVFSKLVFLNQPFLQGLIWMRMFSFLFVLFFLFDKKLRSQIFTKKANLDKKTGAIFLLTQSVGGTANILQSFSISLAPVAYLATINSLRGVQYVFLFIITLFFSYFFPKIMKEDISKKALIQKAISIFFIVIGLAILVIN